MKKQKWGKAILVSLGLLAVALILLWPRIRPARVLTPVMPEGAAETDELLTPLAEEMILEDETYGTYTKLDQFVEKARATYPELSDEALAGFVARYTGQPELAVEESNALFLLEYDNITTEKRTDEEGYTLTVSYSNTGDNGYNQEYDLWATATWQSQPAHGRNTTLKNTTNNAVFDDSVRERGAVLQQFSCKKCGEVTNACRNISGAYPHDRTESLCFDYQGGRPAIDFKFLKSTCQSCGSRRGEETFCMAFVSYGVILNGMTSTGNFSANVNEGSGVALLLQPTAE